MRTAFEYAIWQRYDVVVTIDCDGQHEPSRIPVLLEAIHNADIVSGSATTFPEGAPHCEPKSVPTEIGHAGGLANARRRTSRRTWTAEDAIANRPPTVERRSESNDWAAARSNRPGLGSAPARVFPDERLRSAGGDE